MGAAIAAYVAARALGFEVMDSGGPRCPYLGARGGHRAEKSGCLGHGTRQLAAAHGRQGRAMLKGWAQGEKALAMADGPIGASIWAYEGQSMGMWWLVGSWAMCTSWPVKC